MAAAVTFESVSHHFAHVRAVDRVSFEVVDGEFFSMLGPSGSGKTTCLRLIAGFERPQSGTILLHGAAAAHLPPFERDVNTVFQDYALFPHMNVMGNVAYGLMVRGVTRTEREQRAGEMLALVKLDGLADRRPGQLSGGQRQRVALARALINHPRVLLLDEPLGALDLKLREQMQIELKDLQRRLRITFIYVTHDQEEALSMSDRLAVFNEGRIEQIGTPEQIYEHPANRFVAGFVGVSNVLPPAVAKQLAGTSAAVSIRPERIRLSEQQPAAEQTHCRIEGTLVDSQYHGAATRLRVALPAGGELTVVRQNQRSRTGEPAISPGAQVWLSWHREDMQVLGDGA